jgi:hypothetical protein
VLSLVKLEGHAPSCPKYLSTVRLISGERRLLVCEAFSMFLASCQKLQASSLRSPDEALRAG